MSSPPTTRLYLTASGAISKVMTATKWRGCPYWIPYTKPGGSVSAAQQAARTAFAAAAAAWRRDFKFTQIRTAWDLLASYGTEPRSGYNAFIAAAYQAAADDRDTVFVTGWNISGDHLSFTGATISGNETPKESQEIAFWISTSPHTQPYRETRKFHYDLLWSPVFERPGTYYVRMTSNGIPICGLIKINYTGE